MSYPRVYFDELGRTVAFEAEGAAIVAAVNAALATAREYRERYERNPSSENEEALKGAIQGAGSLVYEFGPRSWIAILEGNLDPITSADYSDQGQD